MLDRRAWTIDSIINFLFWVFLGLAGVVVVGAVLTRWLTIEPQATREFVVGFTGMLVFYAAVLVGLVRLLRANQLTWSEAFGLRNQPWPTVCRWAAGAAAVLFPVNLGLMFVAGRIFQALQVAAPLQEHVQLLQGSHDLWQPVLIGFLAMFLAPVMEELLFRGLLYPGLKGAGFPRLAWWGTPLLFGLSHGNLLSLVPLTFFGLAQIWLYERTNTLLVPIVTHLLFNLINFLLALTFRV
ncbi:MAG: CPBP family intramembrane metalloprotease [Verrucomicrobiales bacterium]|nr:CPBP family intramembrane metalloprotease [Verrucomicrobiales bacterium]